MPLSTLHVAVITVSDRCARGEAIDRSGPAVMHTIQSFMEQRYPTSSTNDATITTTTAGEHDPTPEGRPTLYFREAVVADDVEKIQRVICAFTDGPERSDETFGSSTSSSSSSCASHRWRPHLLITTGGTGFAVRDITPEAVAPLLHKTAPGLVQHMLMASLPHCSSAWLSRAVAGVRHATLIITLPGSTKAVEECLAPLLHTGLLHAVELATNASSPAPSSSLPPPPPPPSSSSSSIAQRPRKSPYAMLPMKTALEMVAAEATNYVQQQSSSLVVRLPLHEALHHVLAEDVSTSFAHPPFRASVKDGYAVKSNEGCGIFAVGGATCAGHVPATTTTTTTSSSTTCASPTTSGWAPRTVWRVNTGGMVPDEADAVVQVEDTELVESDAAGRELQICVLRAATPGQDIRPIGVDMPANTVVLRAGTFITAAEVAVATAIGCHTLAVHRKASVALFSTGDELVDVSGCGRDGTTHHVHLPPGKILDSNKAMLLAALRELHYAEVGNIHDLGVVRDSLEATKAKIQEGLRAADVVVSTGGVSMGDVDHIKTALMELGATLVFGRVHMKPGKPTTFAVFRQHNPPKVFFGLPGNPVSALVCFHLFVVPYLRRCGGMRGRSIHYPVIRAVLADASIRLDDERPEYRRCTITRRVDDDDGDDDDAVPLNSPTSSRPEFVATSCGGQASSRLLSLSSANGLMMLPCEKGHRVAGDVVEVLLVGRLV